MPATQMHAVWSEMLRDDSVQVTMSFGRRSRSNSIVRVSRDYGSAPRRAMIAVVLGDIVKKMKSRVSGANVLQHHGPADSASR